MTNLEIYEVMIKIDNGYTATIDEEQLLDSITDIKWRGITDLPKCMGVLKSLKNLRLTNTNIKDIRSLSALKELTYLDLGFTEINDISALSKLHSLTNLNLSGTNVSDIKALSDLQSLTDLNLSVTRVSDISPLSKLTNLTSLYLNYTEITDINALSTLKSLKYLLLRRTKVSDINPLSNLKELRMLYLGETQVSDLNALSGLPRLLSLDLSKTNSCNLSALSSLKSLTFLNLQNSITDLIPESLLDLNLEFINEENSNDWISNPGIYIYGLTLTNQPVEVFGQSKELIRAFYRDGNQVPVNECKVFFLGDAESGKTHSIKRLLNGGEYLVDFYGESTPGIETTVSRIIIEDSEITVNYWDFGGQEIQHSMHRIFMTERTVYVVFLNARQDELIDERARYWMENIKAFAPEAPVLVVINKIDQNENPRFNEKGFLSAYGNQVKKVIRLSAKKDNQQVFLEKLQGGIISIIMGLPTVRKKIPRSWKTLMESIRTMTDFYLTKEQFLEKCVLCNVKDYLEIHNELVDLFQVTGVGFCYYKDRAIADYMLLNPVWMLNAIYTIVTNGKAVAYNGVITQNDFYDLLQEDTVKGVKIKRVRPSLRYTSVEVNYILGVIRMFGLSYCIKDGSEFFPMLCDGDEKISAKEVVPENALHFIFRYKFLPTNIIHRLIVEMQRNLDYQNVWYTGAIFRNELQNQTAYIHSIGNDLHIYVYGREEIYSLNEYLTPISNVVRIINKDMGLSAEELLTFRKNGVEVFIPYEEVVGNLRNQIYTRYDAAIKDYIDYRIIAGRYIDENPQKDNKLLQSIIKALQTMQNEKTFYRTEYNSIGLEDSRNRFVSAQLKAAGYFCSDQQPGGIGLNGKAPGERDFVVKDKNGEEQLAYEGINLVSFNKAYINKHIRKLLVTSNPLGLRKSVLVTYLECDRDKFRRFTDVYRKNITEYAPQYYRCVGEPFDVLTNGQYLACMQMDYEAGGVYFLIYHIIVRVAP